MLDGMHLKTMPEVVDPAMQARIRGRMLSWYVNMGHQSHYDDTAGFRSFGDLKLAAKPTLRDFLNETASVYALSVGSANHGAA